MEDDGNGIASKDLPHLFERCYKGNGGNFGIGLAIATSAAERMKGSVKGEKPSRRRCCVYAYPAEIVIIYRNPLIGRQSLYNETKFKKMAKIYYTK